MSIWADEKLKELEARIVAVEKRLEVLESPVSFNDETGDLEGTLRSEYKKKFGKPPHHRMLAESIRKALGLSG